MEMESKWSRLIGRRGRDELPRLLWQLFKSDELDMAGLAEAIANAWSSAESPEHELEQHRWLELLSRTGFILEGEQAVNPVTSTLRLYRGASFDRRRRMSWTEDEDLAKWFAIRALSEGRVSAVWTADVTPRRLLARSSAAREGEVEWIVNPHRMQIRSHIQPEELGYVYDVDTWAVTKAS